MNDKIQESWTEFKEHANEPFEEVLDRVTGAEPWYRKVRRFAKSNGMLLGFLGGVALMVLLRFRLRPTEEL